MQILSKPGESARVLIVEDERLIADEIEERLKRLGFHTVGIVDNADDALKTARRELPELVLMDVRLKGRGDGIEAAARIRKELNIAVIFLTAHSDKKTRARAMETTPCGYILKPFREEDLRVAIETALHLNVQERRLQDSKLRYAATLASILDGVVATDEEGRVTFMNPVAETLSGWTFQEAQGISVEEVLQFIDESDRIPLENPVRRALTTGDPVELAAAKLLVGRDNQAIPVDDNAAPITTERGTVLGAVIAFRDLRGRRITEEALRKTREQLNQSQKLDAIGRLAGGVAHDFNNLLTVMNGCANLALDDPDLNAATRDLLREIEDAGERAAALTSQLLAFSRKQVLAPVVLNLNLVMKDMENMLRRMVGEDISLQLSLSPSLSNVRADPSQLEQVVMNLVVNAREAMEPGGRLSIQTSDIEVGEDGISTSPGLQPGSYVLLTVKDTGQGMSAATQANIFEPFFTTKKATKGTGLGLATVHGIVTQSGGEIFVSSELDRGTTFSIYLPRIGVQPTSITPAADSPRARPGTETILMVEDEDGVRSVLASALRRFGYRVLPARSGKDAIEICQSFDETIHLVLTDVVMPEMGGFELADRVRALRPGVPILYLSGYIDQEVVRHHGAFEGQTAFLQKPAGPNLLAMKVRQVLDSYDESRDYTRTGARHIA